MHYTVCENASIYPYFSKLILAFVKCNVHTLLFAVVWFMPQLQLIHTSIYVHKNLYHMKRLW